MLKVDGFILMVVLLVLMNGDLPPYIANVLAFLAGLCLKTLPDVINKQITLKEFVLRLMKMAGLITVAFLIWNDRQIKTNIIYFIIPATLCSELIIYVGTKLITAWIDKYAKKIDNE